jgi:hypothetical protein
MPLLDLKTDLKSLKYGKDQPGGGDSGQPYQQVNINTVDSGFNRFRMTKFDDGLIRGGIVGAANASIVDTFRIGKFLTDFPQGPLFIVRQVGLQLSNPRLETKAIPNVGGSGFLSNIINSGINFLNKNSIGPTRIYNLGINTLAQVPVNAFGIHLNRHGLLPVQDENTKYLAVVQANNPKAYVGAGLPKSSTNRLVQKAIELLPPQTKTGRVLSTIQSALSVFGITLPGVQNRQIIDDYIGGPGSVYGIGRTTIRRYDYTSNGINKQDPQEKGKVNYIGTLGLSQQYFSSYNSSLGIGGLNISSTPGLFGSLFGAAAQIVSKENAAKNLRQYNSLDSNNPTKAPSNIDTATYGRIITGDIPLKVIGNKLTPLSDVRVEKYVSVKSASYQKYQQIINSRKLRERTYILDGNQVNAFGIYGNRSTPLIGNNNILPDSTQSPVYSNGNEVVKINIPWDKVTREKRIGSGRQDEINLTPLFSNSKRTIDDEINIGGTKHNINDLVKFRIQSLTSNNTGDILGNWMIFRAYLTQLTDNTNASWNEIKYAGRGDRFYVYDGFTRQLNISFKVAALSAIEMEPMYQKLNYLMGNLMPDYNNNLMRGPLVRMTVGNWIDGQDGIINSLSYNIPQDSPWEIAINEPINGENILILPHIVEVQMTFTPIGSQTRGVNLISEKSNTTSHIAQNANESSTNQYITGSILAGT